jgi:hypothetical protein
MTDNPKSTRSQGARASAQFRAFRPRVIMEPVDRNRRQVMLDGEPTELVVTCFIEEGRWTVSKTSGEIISRNSPSAAAAEDVAALSLWFVQVIRLATSDQTPLRPTWGMMVCRRLETTRQKSVNVPAAYVRRVDLFKDYAGAAFL